MNIYEIVVLGAWAVFIGVWAVTGARAKPSAPGAASPKVLLVRTLFLFAIVFIMVAAGKARALFQPRELYPAVGSALTVAGIACAIWARVNLGSNWGMPMTQKEDRELVTSGPYALVRHPIYTGVIIALLGSAGVSGGLWLIVSLAGVIYFILAAREEEAMLLKEFPDVYPAYRARTWMLVPFIW